jgi:hypothetical protein
MLSKALAFMAPKVRVLGILWLRLCRDESRPARYTLVTNEHVAAQHDQVLVVFRAGSKACPTFPAEAGTAI